MKPVGIITDSCSGISQKEASERGIFVLPMPFYVESQCLYEGVDLDRDDFMEKLRTGADVSTSQPSPAEVTALWDQALSEYEKVLYMPISSGLSGSCETAYALTRDESMRGESWWWTTARWRRLCTVWSWMRWNWWKRDIRLKRSGSFWSGHRTR